MSAFVYGLSLGVRGSAAGTLVAEALGALAGLLITWHMCGDLFSAPRELVFDPAKIARMFAINRDIFVRNTALLFAFAFFTAQGARGGDIMLAGNAILLNLVLVAAFFLDGFATAAEQLCGQAVGAQSAPSFHAAVRLTLLWCFVFAAGLSLAALAFGDAFIAVLSTSPQVRAFASAYLVFAALMPLAGALAYEFDGVLYRRDLDARHAKHDAPLARCFTLRAFICCGPTAIQGCGSRFFFFSSRGALPWRGATGHCRY